MDLFLDVKTSTLTDGILVLLFQDNYCGDGILEIPEPCGEVKLSNYVPIK